jgi:hypothetical protein
VRKIAMLVGVAALIIVLAAPMAFGVMRHQCSGRPCTGTNSANYLDERHGNGTPDLIRGNRGRDHLDAGYWTRDRDRLYGNRGRDSLNVLDGDTRVTVSGGPGRDTCVVDPRAELGGGCQRVQFGG